MRYSKGFVSGFLDMQHIWETRGCRVLGLWEVSAVAPKCGSSVIWLSNRVPCIWNRTRW